MVFTDMVFSGNTVNIYFYPTCFTSTLTHPSSDKKELNAFETHYFIKQISFLHLRRQGIEFIEITLFLSK